MRTLVASPPKARSAVLARTEAMKVLQSGVQSARAEMRKGRTGTMAPREKAAKDPMAARQGEPRSSGSRPSSSRARVSRAVSGLAMSSSATC